MISTRCILPFQIIVSVQCSFVFQRLQIPNHENFNIFAAAADGQKLAKRVEAMVKHAEAFIPSGGSSLQQAKLRNEDRNDSPASVDGAEASRQILMRAGHLFDSVSSREDLEEDSSIKAALQNAMVESTAQVSTPDRSMPHTQSRSCVPNLQMCPVSWHGRGGICAASDTYDGPCAVELNFAGMNSAQKLATGRACGLDWPCADGCEQDFSGACPELWDEISFGICMAPTFYTGNCEQNLNTTGLSSKDKMLIAARCDASWPCDGIGRRAYSALCPQGWTAQGGGYCAAPSSYVGQCDHVKQFISTEVAEKQSLEKACGVSWPVASQCVRDLSVLCPLGWYRNPDWSGVDECLAPSWYSKCNRMQSFGDMSFEAKQNWAVMCGVDWPCLDRTACEIDYSQPCPAEWLVFNGGKSCAAPGEYAGPCAVVMHGLHLRLPQEKNHISEHCNAKWPCLGEILLSSFGAFALEDNFY